MRMPRCESFGTIVVGDKLWVCEGNCATKTDCVEESSCKCHGVDRNWQPDLQDFATLSVSFIHIHELLCGVGIINTHKHAWLQNFSSIIITLYCCYKYYIWCRY